MTQKSFNLVKELGKYWEMFGDSICLVRRIVVLLDLFQKN
jgi:hypothetical protein